MSDVLIRDVPEEVVSAIDARVGARPVPGTSTCVGDYVKTRRHGSRPVDVSDRGSSRRCSPTWLIRMSWPRRGRDLRVSGVDSVADRHTSLVRLEASTHAEEWASTNRTWPGANHYCHAAGDGVTPPAQRTT